MNNKTILKGTYCILINLKDESAISIGKIGKTGFQKGYYAYVGSALNSLEGRIKRHISSDKKLYWHIDYFLAHKNTEIVEILYAIDNQKWECKLANNIAIGCVGVNKFGCSDCKCDSHLFYSTNHDDLKKTCLNAFKKLKLNPEMLTVNK